MSRDIKGAVRCLAGLAVMGCAIARGHEGHQPLPVKGVQVDVSAGTVVLSSAARGTLDVQTVEVEQVKLRGSINAYANVVSPWTRRAFVTSRLPGRIAKLHVRPGDTVRQGQILAELESLDLQTLRLEFQKAQTEYQLATTLLESIAPAAESGAVSRQRLVEAHNSQQSNWNSMELFRAKANSLGVSEQNLISTFKDDEVLRMPLLSPIDGEAVHADVAIGQFVEPSSHLFEVIDTSRLWLRIGVLESQLHHAVEGSTVRAKFTAFPDREILTVIDKVSLLLDPLTHQGTAWAQIDNTMPGQRVLPGMTGQVEISLSGEKERLAIPQSAVFSDGAERYVFVETSSTKSESEYRKRVVVLGQQHSGRVEVISGDLYLGDRVVTRGGHELSSLFFLGVLKISPETARSIGLRVEQATWTVVDNVLSFDGVVDVPPHLRTNASSQMTGTIRRLLVDRGQTVAKGDVLAEVASLEFQDLQLDFLASHLDHGLWNDTVTRYRMAADALPKRMLVELESRVTRLQSQVNSARQKLSMLGLTREQIDGVIEKRTILDAFPIRSPIGGSIVHFDQVVGQVVRADEPLFEIHDISRPWVQAYIRELDSSQVRTGQSVRFRLTSFADREFTGKVARLGPIVGELSRTQAAWIEFEPPTDRPLLHNMLARVTVSIHQPTASLAIPLEALVRDGLNRYVFVEQSNGQFARRRIQVGRMDDRNVEVLSGLSTEERVAVGGVSQLQTAYASLR